MSNLPIPPLISEVRNVPRESFDVLKLPDDLPVRLVDNTEELVDGEIADSAHFAVVCLRR